jgi:predicted phage gp36 major capsid-like protein
VLARGKNLSITKEKHMDIDTENELETKAGILSDAAVTHAALMRAFEEFKEANDLRLAGTVRHRTDVLLNEKLARIDRAIDTHARRLDEITLKGARPTIGNGRSLVGSPEHKAAFSVG